MNEMHAFAFLKVFGVVCAMGIVASVGCQQPVTFEQQWTAPNNDAGAYDATYPTSFTNTKDGRGCALGCSNDLHSVMDCNDHLVSTCPANQGCAAGRCVDACDAAKANQTTVGCDYWTFEPETNIVGGLSGNCFAAFVVNTWTSPVTIELERAGQKLNVADAARIPSGTGRSITYAPLPGGQLPQGQMAIVFLASNTQPALSACPAGVTPALQTDPTLGQTGIGDAFHLSTSAPVVAYDIYPYGGGDSAITAATLLLPTAVWDTNYIAVDAYRQYPGTQFPPWSAVVAEEDATEVTINPTADIVGGNGVLASAKGKPATYSLNRGQYLQFVQTDELIGSPVQSNNPIGFFGGFTCMFVPAVLACDGAHQQIPPVRALGSEYVGVRHANRYQQKEESPPWRLVGAVDGTALFWQPSIPAGAPTKLKKGEVEEFTGTGPFVVSSQDAAHPFYLAQYMTGCAEYVAGTTGGCRGDPEFVNVVPALQYLSDYTFFTDPTYPETHLVAVRKLAEDGTYKDVSLDCVTGPIDGWKTIGTSDYQYARIDLVTGNFEKVGNCDNGLHRMKSDGSFGVTVWGWGSDATTDFSTEAVSYAYPAGMSVQSLNKIVVTPNPN